MRFGFIKPNKLILPLQVQVGLLKTTLHTQWIIINLKVLQEKVLER